MEGCKEAEERLNHECKCKLTSQGRTTHNYIIQTRHDNLNMFIMPEQCVVAAVTHLDTALYTVPDHHMTLTLNKVIRQ